MRVVTSFSTKLYSFCGKKSLQSFVSNEELVGNVLAFHENSVSVNKISEKDYVKGVEFLDLFVCCPDLIEIVNYPEFPLPDSSASYLNRNAKFFFRKVASLYHSIFIVNTPLLVWLDCDILFKKPFDDILLDFVMSYDICYIDRNQMPTESGVIFFKMNKRVREFIIAWFNLTKTKKIFKVLKEWADHNAFDYLRAGEFSDLSFGKLRTGEGRCLWYDDKHQKINPKEKEYNCHIGWRYLQHNKGKNRVVRGRV